METKNELEEEIIWEKTANRFVAFFDIMGFKDFVYRNSHDVVLKKLEFIHETLIPIEDNFEESFNSIKNGIIVKKSGNWPACKTVIFSDSILIFSVGDTLSDAENILFDCKWLMNHSMMNNIPMKGAISHGLFTANIEKSIYFGQPLIDAYNLSNEMKLYGGLLHNTFENHSQINGFTQKIKDDYMEYKVPLGNSKINHKVINYFTENIKINIGAYNNITESIINPDPEEFKKSVIGFYNQVSGLPRIYVDNTLDLINFLLEKKYLIHK